MQQLTSVISQKDKIMESVEKEKEKYATECKGFKERCKQMEQEFLEQRGIENMSMFGNSVISVANVTTNGGNKKSDYELKHVKEIYDKQLSKVNEDVAKKTIQIKDKDVEC